MKIKRKLWFIPTVALRRDPVCKQLVRLENKLNTLSARAARLNDYFDLNNKQVYLLKEV